MVIDPEPPGAGASYGNAGTIADYAVMPVGTPDVLKTLPSLLLDRTSPLAIRKAALPTLAPWLLRFLRQSLPGPAMRNAHVLAHLVADAAHRWRDLADEIGAGTLLRQTGSLYLYDTPRAFDRATDEMTTRRSLGVTVEMLTPQAVGRLEPNLPQPAGGAAFFPNTYFVSDPGNMAGLLAEAARAAGVTFLRARIDGLNRTVTGVDLTGTADLRPAKIHTRRAVIAAGAHSRALARAAGDRVPLDTERGYHLEYDMAEPLLTRPTCPTARGFYLCPMAGRLRVAGTVELGGLTAPPSPHRLARLAEGARAIFPDLPAPAREWMGFRPSIPDSLPVVGPSKGGAEVLLAFGHGHIGLTLAPMTAALIEGWIAGAPMAGFEAVLPARF